MTFTLSVPSLKYLGFVNVTTSLWKCNFNRINTFDDWPNKRTNHSKHPQWTDMENEICIILDNILIPDSLRETLRNEFVHDIGWDLNNWIATLGAKFSTFDRTKLELFVKHTQWTLHGKIDTISSIKSLSHCKEVPLLNRFNIACYFYVEDAVREIWQQMSINERGIQSKKFCSCREMIKFWKGIILGHHVYEYYMILDYFFLYSNKEYPSVVDYFYNTCKKEKKFDFMLRTINFRGAFSAEVLFYILSKMNDTQLQVIFTLENSLNILFTAVEDWVYSDFLVTIFNRTRQFLDERSFCLLVNKIAKRKMSSYKYNFFKFVWSNGLPEWKKYIFSYLETTCKLFGRLCDAQDFRIIEMCLSELEPGERQCLLSRLHQEYIDLGMAFQNGPSIASSVFKNRYKWGFDFELMMSKMKLEFKGKSDFRIFNIV